MDLHRIWVVIKKDMAWIRGDLKLLGTVSVVPVFMILMFSTVSRMNITEGIHLNASTGVDINIMGILLLICTTGCITTSQLILQEKEKGTLLALLITPLKYQEFILGKLFFTFTLSLLFAIIFALTSGMKDSIFNPIVILNIALFIGTVCFIGCVAGIFSDTELENNTMVFITLVFFTSAFILKSIASPNLQIFYFVHPTSHFFEIFSVNSFQNLLIHTGFNLLFFVGFFFFSVLYIRFYFSNDKEKRFSFPLFFSLCVGFLGLFILSALLFLTNQYDTKKTPKDQTTNLFKLPEGGKRTYDLPCDLRFYG